jgi:hypothetical protein
MDGSQDLKSTKQTSESLTHPSTRDEWIASQAGFLARTLASLEAAKVLTASDPASGQNLLACFARYDRDSHSLKTAQLSFFEDSTECCRILPRWGSMRNGQLFQRRTLGLRIFENAYGLWPTVRASDGERGGRGDLIQAVRGNPNRHYRTWPTPTASCIDMDTMERARLSGQRRRAMKDGGKAYQTRSRGILNPTWVEWLQGWPLRWTELGRSATVKSRSKRRSLGAS